MPRSPSRQTAPPAADLEQNPEKLVEARKIELRRALDTVRTSESRVRAIVEMAQDAFIGVDLTGIVIERNRQTEPLLAGAATKRSASPERVSMLLPMPEAIPGEMLLLFYKKHQSARYDICDKLSLQCDNQRSN